nr:cbb3-type cytochrome c oxidase subunit II [Desulfobacula sp.]
LNRCSQRMWHLAENKGFKIKANDTLGTHYTKDEILSLIRTMRKKKATFAAIADYLKEKGIPTFSGRGEWHAQTIHRLCK